MPRKNPRPQARQRLNALRNRLALNALAIEKGLWPFDGSAQPNTRLRQYVDRMMAAIIGPRP